MAAADNSPPKDISKWLTAPETLALAENSKGQFAVKVLSERLKGGVLTAVASKTSQALGTGAITVQEKPRKIAPTLWQHRTDDSFWSSGDVHFRVPDPRALRPSNNVWCYDIRFDPDVIAEMFPPTSKTGTDNDALLAKYGYATTGGGQSAKIPPPPPQVAAVPDTRKPVSKADLARWAKVFVGIHTEFTGDFALRSATAMFPDNTVGRDRVAKAISDLTGPRTRGPKKSISQGK